MIPSPADTVVPRFRSGLSTGLMCRDGWGKRRSDLRAETPIVATGYYGSRPGPVPVQGPFPSRKAASNHRHTNRCGENMAKQVGEHVPQRSTELHHFEVEVVCLV